jgi:hypothetical protein
MCDRAQCFTEVCTVIGQMPIGTSMVRKRKTPSIQIVVRRGALRRFASLNEKRGELPVALLWDRRLNDRRTDAGESTGERRVRERRREPPFTWTTAEFLVIETPAEPEKPAKKPAARGKSTTSGKKSVKKR